LSLALVFVSVDSELKKGRQKVQFSMSATDGADDRSNNAQPPNITQVLGM